MNALESEDEEGAQAVPTSSGAIDDSSLPLSFALEDTNERCYRDITHALVTYGWKQVNTRKKSKLEKKRFPLKDAPLLTWLINEKDVDFKELAWFQVCNHYEGITKLTTKMGFCELLSEMDWIEDDATSIAPRCYNLGDSSHRDDFIDDFRITAVMNIFKWALQMYLIYQQDKRIAELYQTLSKPMFKWLQKAGERYLRHKGTGEWPGVDRTFPEHETGSTVTGLNEDQWCKVLQFSYEITEGYDNDFRWKDIKERWHTAFFGGDTTKGNGRNRCKASPKLKTAWRLPFFVRMLKVYFMVDAYNSLHSQFHLDGWKNIWIVKASEAGRGVGMRVLCRLDDILECGKDMGGARTVQKYIENPLLSPAYHNYQLYLQHKHQLSSGRTHCATHTSLLVSPPLAAMLEQPQSSSSSSPSLLQPHHMVLKFDIRVWVLVVSFDPLKVHIFPRVYGRRCGSIYSLQTKKLNDNMIHLTNYSIQKKNPTSAGAAHMSFSGTANGGSSLLVQEKDEDEYATSVQGEKPMVTASASATGLQALRNLRATGNTGNNKATVDHNQGTSQQFADNKPQLLIEHDEVTWLVNNHNKASISNNATASSAEDHGDSCVWQSSIWPKIKQKIIRTLQMAQQHVTHRNRSFQLIGYDVLIDRELEPWILEANMSPAMAHRCTSQNLLIAHMCEGLVRLAVLPYILKPEEIHCLTAHLKDKFSSAEEAYSSRSHEGRNGSNSCNEQQTATDYIWESLIDEESSLSSSSSDSRYLVRPSMPKSTTSSSGSRPKSAGASRRLSNGNRPMSAGSSYRQAQASSSNAAANSNNTTVDFYYGPTAYQPQTGATDYLYHYSHSSGGSSNSGTSALAVVGHEIHTAAILHIDVSCQVLERKLLLQRWAKRYLIRLRLFVRYKERLRILLQSVARGYLARSMRRRHRRLVGAVLKAGLIMRNKVAIRAYHSRQRRAATMIQANIRRHLAVLKRNRLRRRRAATFIQHGYREYRRMKRCRAARALFQPVRWLLAHKRRCRALVAGLVKLNYWTRKRCTRVLQRAVRNWSVRMAFALSLAKVQLRAWSQAIALHAVVTQERWACLAEDSCSKALRDIVPYEPFKKSAVLSPSRRNAENNSESNSCANANISDSANTNTKVGHSNRPAVIASLDVYPGLPKKVEPVTAPISAAHTNNSIDSGTTSVAGKQLPTWYLNLANDFSRRMRNVPKKTDEEYNVLDFIANNESYDGRREVALGFASLLPSSSTLSSHVHSAATKSSGPSESSESLAPPKERVTGSDRELHQSHKTQYQPQSQSQKLQPQIEHKANFTSNTTTPGIYPQSNVTANTSASKTIRGNEPAPPAAEIADLFIREHMRQPYVPPANPQRSQSAGPSTGVLQKKKGAKQQSQDRTHHHTKIDADEANGGYEEILYEQRDKSHDSHAVRNSRAGPQSTQPLDFAEISLGADFSMQEIIRKRQQQYQHDLKLQQQYNQHQYQHHDQHSSHNPPYSHQHPQGYQEVYVGRGLKVVVPQQPPSIPMDRHNTSTQQVFNSMPSGIDDSYGSQQQSQKKLVRPKSASHIGHNKGPKGVDVGPLDTQIYGYHTAQKPAATGYFASALDLHQFGYRYQNERQQGGIPLAPEADPVMNHHQLFGGGGGREGGQSNRERPKSAGSAHNSRRHTSSSTGIYNTTYNLGLEPNNSESLSSQQQRLADSNRPELSVNHATYLFQHYQQRATDVAAYGYQQTSNGPSRRKPSVGNGSSSSSNSGYGVPCRPAQEFSQPHQRPPRPKSASSSRKKTTKPSTGQYGGNDWGYDASIGTTFRF